jgi:hypothetical protein
MLLEKVYETLDSLQPNERGCHIGRDTRPTKAMAAPKWADNSSSSPGSCSSASLVVLFVQAAAPKRSRCMMMGRGRARSETGTVANPSR